MISIKFMHHGINVECVVIMNICQRSTLVLMIYCNPKFVAQSMYEYEVRTVIVTSEAHSAYNVKIYIAKFAANNTYTTGIVKLLYILNISHNWYCNPPVHITYEVSEVQQACNVTHIRSQFSNCFERLYRSK
jgi:hypothetical protein